MRSPSSTAVLICAASLLATACGKSPTEPSGSTGPIVNTFMGVLSVPGGIGGTLQLRAAGSLASVTSGAGRPLLARVLAWIEPVAAAQGSTAAGILVTDELRVVNLSGTYGANTFNVSGGGYAITATVANSAISGSGTAPGGASAVVTPPEPVPVSSPPPANPSGTYAGDYRVDALASYKNTLPSDGSVLLDCTYNASVTGRLTMTITNGASGQVTAELTNNWTETPGGGTCSSAVSGAPVSPVGPTITRFEGPAANLVLGRVEQGPLNLSPGATGAVTRTEGFVGAVSGTTIVGRASRSFQFVNAISSPPRNHISGYPTVSVLVTLTKQ